MSKPGMISMRRGTLTLKKKVLYVVMRRVSEYTDKISGFKVLKLLFYQNFKMGYKDKLQTKASLRLLSDFFKMAHNHYIMSVWLIKTLLQNHE